MDEYDPADDKKGKNSEDVTKNEIRDHICSNFEGHLE
jgi:hypothetical protein